MKKHLTAAFATMDRLDKAAEAYSATVWLASGVRFDGDVLAGRTPHSLVLAVDLLGTATPIFIDTDNIAAIAVREL